MKKSVDEADDSILSDLIAQCEKKMGSKFAPKEEEKPEIEIESSESEDEDLDEEKMKKLLEMYKSSKG